MYHTNYRDIFTFDTCGQTMQVFLICIMQSFSSAGVTNILKFLIIIIINSVLNETSVKVDQHN